MRLHAKISRYFKFAINLWIDKLIGIEGEENTTQETRFANYLRQLFPADVRTMTVAARALGNKYTPCQVFGLWSLIFIYHMQYSFLLLSSYSFIGT